MKDLSNYLVNNPKQVLLHLKTLASEKCLITTTFAETQSFLTAILDIDEKKKIIIIDCGPKEYLNKELLSRGIVSCTTDIKGIKVLFEGRGIKKAGKSGQLALSMKIPPQIYWIQRREFYRIRSPLSKNSYCSLLLDEKEDGKPITFKLFDLSARGFSILVDTIEESKSIEKENTYNNCKLVLDAYEPLQISISIRNKTPLNPNKPTKSQRIGCAIENHTPRIETALLRYMHEIERERKKNFD